MFKPIIPTLPNPFAYLDGLSQFYKRQTQLPTLAQTRPFQPHIPALRPYGPLAQQQQTQRETSMTAGPVATTTPFPNMPPANGPLSSTTSPLGNSSTDLPGMKATLKLDLSQARIANTLRQVPENLREAWNALGQDWWSQFSTWQQSYVNSFLEKYAAGDFAAANQIAQSWYDKKAAYAKNNGTAEQQQAEQDYFDQQSQYRMSGYIG